MQKRRLVYLLILFFPILTNNLVSQASVQFDEAFAAYTDEEKFLSYIDTINKYTYIDNQIVNLYLEECEALFNKDLNLSSDDKLSYILVLISSGLEKHEPLQSFQLIQDYQYLLDDEDVPAQTKTHFAYLSAYTSFTLEDTKTAQETFYTMYDNAAISMDTANMIKSLYSLGQIYMDDENYPAALEYFYKVKVLDEKSPSDASSFCLIRFEISAVYIELKEYDKALELINESLEYIEENNIREFTSDFLLLKGQIAFDQKDFKTVQDVLDKSVAFMEATDSYYMLHASQIFNAKLLTAKGLYKSALTIYESLLEDTELPSKKKLEIYELAHALCNKAGQQTKAYDYLMLAKAQQMDIEKNKKIQQTAYLKIKFDSAQKDKENQLLAAQVLQKQSQSKFLYALIALSVVGLLVLFGAYYQKQKFAQKLELEVSRQTKTLNQLNEELNETNDELSEFNRILSHDLKEPLRSIVSFSGLVRKETTQNSKATEYITFVEKSGQQLHQIIEDVSTFQSINHILHKPFNKVNTQIIVDSTIQKIKNDHPTKSIAVKSPAMPTLYANPNVLDLVFRHLIENGIFHNDSPTAEVHITYSKSKEHHIFEFQDNGIGIAPKYHQQIFGMFKRLHNRKAYNGSGLGLSMVKKVLEKINGNIQILHSDQATGSLFQISFPIIHGSKKYNNDHAVEASVLDL